MPEKSDIIIIGGGIAGGSLAAKVSANADVLLFEAEEVFGYHSTGRSAAMYAPNYGNEIICQLTRAGYPDLENLGVLSPRGLLTVASADDRHLMDQLVDQEGTDRISVERALEMVPILKKDVIADAALGLDEQDIDVDLLFQNYMKTARQNGARLVTNARITDIRFSGDWWFVSAGGEEYSAPIIVNAAGAWADNVAKMAGAEPMGIQPYRRSVARLPAPAGYDVSNWPMIFSASENWYAKPDAGKWLVSPAEADPVEPMDAWADDMVLAEGLARYQEYVTAEVTRVESNWAGLRSFTADNTPVVGFDPAAKGFFWLAGQGGYGVQTSPAISSLASAILNGITPEFDADIIDGLSPLRGK